MFVLYYLGAALMFGFGAYAIGTGTSFTDRAILLLIYSGILCIAAEVNRSWDDDDDGSMVQK